MTLERMIGILEKCKDEDPNAKIIFEDETSCYSIDRIVIDLECAPITVILQGSYMH